MAAVTVMHRRCWSRWMLLRDTVSLTSATSPSGKEVSSSPLSSPVSRLRPEADAPPVLPPMALLMEADMELSGVMVSSSSFSRVSLLSAAASTIISMRLPSSVTSDTVVVSCSAAATCM